MIRLNKKGLAIEHAIPYVVVLGAGLLFLFILAASSINKAKTVDNRLDDSFMEVGVKNQLIQFLRAPANDHETNAELLDRYYLEGKKDEFKNMISGISFKGVEGNVNIRIIFPDGSIKNTAFLTIAKDKKHISGFMWPSSDGEYYEFDIQKTEMDRQMMING